MLIVESGVKHNNPNPIEKSGLLVTKSLISLQKEMIPLRVNYLNKEAHILYRETIAGVIEPVEELKE